jgi:hypothetical protein
LSRGLGYVQSFLLSYLSHVPEDPYEPLPEELRSQRPRWVSLSDAVDEFCYDDEQDSFPEPTRAQYEAFARAARTLERRGLIERRVGGMPPRPSARATTSRLPPDDPGYAAKRRATWIRHSAAGVLYERARWLRDARRGD